jgi:transcriptional regulator with XRE-family HTH domain
MYIRIIYYTPMSKYNLIRTPSTVMKELVLKTQQLRKNNKISQLELSKRSGVSFGSVKRFETTGQISLESLLKLAYFFNRLDDFTSVFLIDPDLVRVERLFSDKTR